MHAFLLGLLACSMKDQSPLEPVLDDSGGGYEADFSTGQYRLNAFTILGQDEGRDWDQDGQPDNNLPNMLSIFDAVLSGFDLSKGGLNLIVADAIDNDTLVLLVDANFDDAELTLDFLTGMVDGDGHLTVDEKSYDAEGEPISRMVGTFVSEDTYSVGPDPMWLAIPVTPSGTLAPFPLEEVRIDGNLRAVTLDGTIVGIVPVASFVEGVLPIFIPAEGFDVDGDDEIGPDESQAALITLATQLLDTGADTVTESGEPAISAAFRFSAGAAAF